MNACGQKTNYDHSQDIWQCFENRLKSKGSQAFVDCEFELEIWIFVARCGRGSGIPEMLKDHKTHFPQRLCNTILKIKLKSRLKSKVFHKALESWILRPFLGWRYCFHGHFWEIRDSVTQSRGKGILIQSFRIIDLFTLWLGL